MNINSTIREVTIGRAKDADIILDRNCVFASSYHATLYMDGGQLMFKDTSSNGSMVNNISVRHRAVPIKQGDSIILAGQYPVSWNQINRFFPSASGGFPAPPVVKHLAIETAAPAQQYPVTDKWSWGAFQFSWIWGLFNGCWWIALVQIALVLLSLIPFVNIVSGLASLAALILYGVNGRRWAWENKSWNSAQEFNEIQDSWSQWGLIFFIGGIVLAFLYFFFFGAAFFASYPVFYL